MFRISQNGEIQLTRGDTARFTVSVVNETTGEPYEIQDTDVLRMTVRKSACSARQNIQKEVVGSGAFHLEPKDTGGMCFGKYVYDIELTTAEGDVYTVIPPTTMEILKEVTYE